MTNSVNYSLEGDIGIISINNPPVNAISHDVRSGIVTAINQAQQDESKLILLICEGRTFVAGADISEFGKPMKEPLLPQVIATVESSRKPVLAALHGTALGGGLELALAAHYRCALPGAKVGLPEVNLGLIPGSGGTQRTPRLIGVQAALDLIINGKPISAQQGLAQGLIDKLIEGDLRDGALAYARELVTAQAPVRRVSELQIDPASVEPGFFEQYENNIKTKIRGLLAPQSIIKAVKGAVELPFTEGLQQERELFLACLSSPQAAAQRHAFFAERKAAKVADVGKEVQPRPVSSVAIIGGGTMGSGIAINFLDAAIPVTMLEVSQEGLTAGLERIKSNYQSSVKKGRLTEDQAQRCIGLLQGSLDYADLGGVDLVIEAVFENMEVKKEVFAKLEQHCKPGCILATNTSYLDVNELASSFERKSDILGMHFFSPANIMKLLEVVRADATSDEVLVTVMQLAKTIKKVPVLVGVCDGFVGNRMLKGYAREAHLLVLEGASPEQVDNAIQNWGMAMGPLAVGDMAGLDISYRARRNRGIASGAAKEACIADALVDMGRLGQKTGKGFYCYDPKTRQRTPDPEVEEVIKQQAERWGVVRRPISDDEIVQRLTFALINEGARIVEEGIAARPSDIDIVYLYGYGFPKFHGGPMHYADTLGLEKVRDGLNALAEQTGEEYWRPAELIVKLAQQGRGFNSLN